jgi:hypothetical protein
MGKITEDAVHSLQLVRIKPNRLKWKVELERIFLEAGDRVA